MGSSMKVFPLDLHLETSLGRGFIISWRLGWKLEWLGGIQGRLFGFGLGLGI